jgi:Tfp pilus assembly protein PilF
MENKEQRITVGVFQLDYHPAATIGTRDYLEEPLGVGSRLSELRAYLAVDTTLKGLRARYVDWACKRLELILEALVGTGAALPDVLVFSEASVPLEALHVIKEFAAAHDVVILAGTHTPPRGAEAREPYKLAGVRPMTLTPALRDDPGQVLPLYQGAKACRLIPKYHQAVVELTDLPPDRRGGSPVELKVETLQLSSGEVKVAVAICADFLRQTKSPVSAQLQIVVALQRDPSVFHAHFDHLRQNGIPGILSNCASSGGSGVFATSDSRGAQWFFGPPYSGRLPPGECYVEFSLSLSHPVPQVGGVDPRPPVSLCRLLPILAADDPLAVLDAEARAACVERNTAKVDSYAKEFERAGAAILGQRWRHLSAHVQVRNASEDVLAALGGSLNVALCALSTLESELAEQAANRLQLLLEKEGNQSLSDAAYGAASKAMHQLQSRASRGSAASSVQSTPRSIIDRIAETEKVCDLINGVGHVLVVQGLPQSGKTAVISKALQDTGARSLTLWCREGSSADYLYEILMREGNQLASGQRPRSSFSPEEIGLALRPFDVVWLRDAQHLTLSRRWSTPAIESLVAQLLTSAEQGSPKIIIESTEGLPDLPVAGLGITRLQIRGLAEKDAIALLMREFRSFLGQPANLDKEVIARLAKLVMGHPRLLSICAEACAKESPAAVLEQLSKGQGAVSASATKLVKDLRLSDAEKTALRCLAEARAAVPAALLVSAVGSSEMVYILEGSSLVERDEGDYIRLAPLLRLPVSTFALPREARSRFHKAASAHFAAVARSGQKVAPIVYAVEANYHAHQAGLPPPCNLDGMLDPVAAVAREHAARKEDNRVVELLRPIVRHGHEGPWLLAKSRPDLVVLYAKALARTAQLKEAMECIEALTSQSAANGVHYLDIALSALSSGHPDVAERCATNARRFVPTAPGLPLLEARICEREGRIPEAFERYQHAASLANRHPWVCFYQARFLLTQDEPEQALQVIDDSLDDATDRFGRVSPRENALRSLQLQALIYAQRFEEAKGLAESLRMVEALAPEALLTLAFVSARETGNPHDAVACFDDLARRAGMPERNDREFRGRIALFRGKVLEQVGDMVGAEEAYNEAAQGQPYHKHVLVSQERALSQLSANRPGDQSARTRMVEVRKRLRKLASSGRV